MPVAVAPPWAAYATGSEVEHFAEFCRDHLIQSVDQWDGLPLELEAWQLRMMGEALAYDERGWPVWRSVVIVLPRKNGKTAMLAAYAVYRLLTSDGSPEILLSAASDKQAGRLFEAAATYVRRSEALRPLCRVRDHVGEIVREDGLGKIVRLASEPSTLHGYNPSLVICDELHAWTTPKLTKAWAALTTGGGARSAPQVFTITTAGEAALRETSILGRMIDGATADGMVEREPGLTVARLPAAQMLVYNHEAPTSDPRDIGAMKLANPASWITEEFLAKQAANPELTDAEVLQLHGCVWTAGRNAWISADTWDSMADPEFRLVDGAHVWVGVDVGLTHDSTAVALAHVREDGRVHVEARVWSADRHAPHDVFCPGGVIQLEDIEAYIREVERRYRVSVVAYDPRFFERSAQMLADSLMMLPVHQSSAPMADAYAGWYQAVQEQRLSHAGGGILRAHVMSTVAEKADRGWRVSKVKQSRRIDAHVASIMAHYATVLMPVNDWGVMV